MAGGVTSVDRGYEALLKRVFGFGRPQIAMGILEKDGAETKKIAPGKAASPAQPTLIQVAQWMEFGFTVTKRDGTTVDVPARSFIRAWFDAAEPELRATLVKLMQGVIKGTHTKEQICELLGQHGAGEIQKRIADGIDPPLAASTIEAKGSDKPLINTGQLRGAASYEVRGR